jgi:glutathione synthase/RimK-type ligase-like ATP-grasp enzyme
LIVVIPDRGTQEGRPSALQLQHEAREKSRSIVVQAFLFVLTRPDIAILIENREGVAML